LLTRSQKVIEKIIAIHSSNPSKKKKANITKNVPLKHAFNSFGKWCSFPQELFNVKKLDRRTQRARGQEINAGRRETKP
jgi:hypothetical protein